MVKCLMVKKLSHQHSYLHATYYTIRYIFFLFSKLTPINLRAQLLVGDITIKVTSDNPLRNILTHISKLETENI